MKEYLMNYAKNIFIVLIVCSVAAYFAVLHKERRQLLTEIADLNRKLTSEKTEREKENQEAKLSMDVQLSKNDSLLQQVASLEKNLIANKKARIKEQEVVKVILDAEINKNKELTTVADKLKEDLEILNQRNQEIANKLERNIKEIQVAEKREVQLEKSWLYKLFN
jgi:vacuolar-type H+-ATPase subunit I/STV1